MDLKQNNYPVEDGHCIIFQQPKPKIKLYQNETKNSYPLFSPDNFSPHYAITTSKLVLKQQMQRGKTTDDASGDQPNWKQQGNDSHVGHGDLKAMQ